MASSLPVVPAQIRFVFSGPIPRKGVRYAATCGSFTAATRSRTSEVSRKGYISSLRGQGRGGRTGRGEVRGREEGKEGRTGRRGRRGRGEGKERREEGGQVGEGDKEEKESEGRKERREGRKEREEGEEKERRYICVAMGTQRPRWRPDSALVYKGHGTYG